MDTAIPNLLPVYEHLTSRRAGHSISYISGNSGECPNNQVETAAPSSEGWKMQLRPTGAMLAAWYQFKEALVIRIIRRAKVESSHCFRVRVHQGHPPNVLALCPPLSRAGGAFVRFVGPSCSVLSAGTCV